MSPGTATTSSTDANSPVEWPRPIRSILVPHVLRNRHCGRADWAQRSSFSRRCILSSDSALRVGRCSEGHIPAAAEYRFRMRRATVAL